MNSAVKVKKPTRSQIIALEDTERHGNPWARVHGQSMHGGWDGVMRVLKRNKWVRLDGDRWWLTDEGRKALRESE